MVRCVLVFAILTGTALAVEPLRLDVGPLPAGCPDVRAQVVARLGAAALADDAARTVRVQVRRERGRLRGVIALGGAERVIEARSGDCGELVQAIALAISIAADPLQLEAPLAPPPVAESPPPGPPPSVAGPPSPSVAESPGRPPEPTPPPAPEPLPTPEPPPLAAPARVAASVAEPPSPPPGPDLTVALGAAVSRGTAPAAAPGFTLEAGARWPAFSLGLEGRADLPVTTAASTGELRTALWAATLVPCLHAGPFAGCALATGGVVRAAGRDLADARRVSAPYVAAGARAAAEWPATSALGLRLWVDARVPFGDVTLRVDDDVAWRRPRLAVGAGLAVVGRR
jgi:hypothetical protein